MKIHLLTKKHLAIKLASLYHGFEENILFFITLFYIFLQSHHTFVKKIYLKFNVKNRKKHAFLHIFIYF